MFDIKKEFEETISINNIFMCVERNKHFMFKRVGSLKFYNF